MLPSKLINSPFQPQEISSQQPLSPIQHELQKKIDSQSQCKQDCQIGYLGALKTDKKETLMKLGQEMFVGLQKRKLKQLYPIFLQSEIEMVAKRLWDGLTSEEKQMYEKKSSEKNSHLADDLEKWEIKMKQRLLQDMEPFSNEDGCNNQETETKNEYPIDIIFQQKVASKMNQEEQGNKNLFNISPPYLSQDFQDNQSSMKVSLNENKIQGFFNLEQIPQNNDAKETQILNFQQSSESIDRQASNLLQEASRQSEQSLQNDTKTSSVIYENSNHAVVGTFETFTLISLTEIDKSEAGNTKSKGNEKQGSGLKNIIDEEKVNEKKDDVKIGDENEKKDKKRLDRQNMQKMDEPK